MIRSRPFRPTALVVLAVLVAGLLALAPSSPAATPEGGRLDRGSWSVDWTGSVPVQVTGFPGAGCIVGVDLPTCDFFTLEIGRFAWQRPAVDGLWRPWHGRDDLRVSIDSAVEFQDFDLFLFDEDGTLLARSATNGSREEVVLLDPDPGTYLVGVGVSLSADPTAEYSATARIENLGRADLGGEGTDGDGSEVESCGLESFPDEVRDIDVLGVSEVLGDPLSILAADDPADPIDIDVLVLLDGVTAGQAGDIFARAAASYAPHGMRLRIAAMETVDFAATTSDAIELIEAARSHVGGVRPNGIDVVEVLTASDIHVLGDTSVAGLADCIGGIAHPDRSFLVAEADIATASPDAPIAIAVDADATVTAHEIGHLLGGQHHYANCIEGVDGDEVEESGRPSVTPCTLMFNLADVVDFSFGTLNGAMVRGMATQYARP